MYLYYSRVLSRRGFETEGRRRAAVRMARERGAFWGYRGRIQFAELPAHCGTRGIVPLEIRVYPAGRF